MKLKHYRKYQAPRMGSTFLEAEGKFCIVTLSAMPEVDELENVNARSITSDSPAETMYFEF